MQARVRGEGFVGDTEKQLGFGEVHHEVGRTVTVVKVRGVGG